MRRVTSLSLSLGLGLVGAALAGCPTPECANLTDCPEGQLCDVTGRCVVDGSLPPIGRDAGPGNDGGGGNDAGPGDDGGVPVSRVPLVRQTNAPVSAIVVDPANADAALVALSGGGLDQVQRLNLVNNTLAAQTVFDFTTEGGCAPDTFFQVVEAGSVNLPAGNETWFSCEGANTLVFYAQVGVADPLRTDIAAADLGTFVISNDAAIGEARLVLAERGGSELTIVRFDGSTDQVQQDRATETVDLGGDSFTAIDGIFLVTQGNDTVGDIVLVYDRGGDGILPRLVPIQRRPDQSTWQGPPLFATNLDTITLPAATHAVLFRTNPGIANILTLETNQNELDVPNVLITLPTDAGGGIARFLRYEAENGENLDVVSPSTVYPDVRLGAITVPGVPDPEEEIMLQEVLAGGQTLFFYALPNTAQGFVIPLVIGSADVTNDVRRASFQSRNDLPVAMFPISGVQAWFGFSNKSELHLVGFDPSF